LVAPIPSEDLLFYAKDFLSLALSEQPPDAAAMHSQHPSITSEEYGFYYVLSLPIKGVTWRVMSLVKSAR
jgi:hypothetical protein